MRNCIIILNSMHCYIFQTFSLPIQYNQYEAVKIVLAMGSMQQSKPLLNMCFVVVCNYAQFNTVCTKKNELGA